ncbi:MAG: hypothetical protein M3Y13_01030 [Armatimonadota bacterium]|nr:hypothetical protein [Armatimonadota bacterium]
MIPFDILLGGLFLFFFVSDLGSLQSPDPDANESDQIINGVACLLDGAITVALFGAGVLLLRRKRAALFQRAVVWSLLLRSGLILVELYLPSEGGLSGIFRIGALLMLVALTGVAACVALALGQQEKQEHAPTVMPEQPGVWPPPPTS